MQGTKKIAINTVFLYIRLLFVLVISLFTVRIVLQSLGEIDYGIYNVVCGFVSMFGFFSTAMTNSVQRYYNYEIGQGKPKGLSCIYSSAIVIQIGLAFLLLLIIEVMGTWYLNNKMVIPISRLVEANWIFQISIINLVITFIQIPYSAAVVAYEKMSFFAIVGIIDAVLKLVTAYMIILMPDRLVSYVTFLLLINIINYSLFYLYTKKNFKELVFSRKLDYLTIKDMLSFTGWNTFGSFAYVVRWQGVNILMNAFFGIIVNAANGIVSQISSALSYFSGNLILAFKPQLTQAYASGNNNRTIYLLYLMTRISFALVFTLSIPLFLEINLILNIWLGNNVPEYTPLFAILVIISVILGCFHAPLAQVIHATGRIRWFQLITSLIIVSILPFSWVAFHFGYSPYWAYYITIIVYVVNQIVGMIMLKKVFNYSYSSYLGKVILPCFVFTILTPIIPLILSNVISDSIIRFLIICFMSIMSSGICTYIIILNSDERNKINLKIKKIITK